MGCGLLFGVGERLQKIYISICPQAENARSQLKFRQQSAMLSLF